MSEKCKYFDECSAPMCPMCEGLENMSWFADEEICRLQTVPEWVKRQRKIAKCKVSEEAGCFTLAMLERRCVIKNGIPGINPETVGEERKKAENNWLKNHPPIKEKTSKEREKLADNMRFVRGLSS